jgi:hypothetical protein
VRSFNPDSLDWYIVLERYGRQCLTAEEFARRREEMHAKYYDYLGRAALRIRGPKFWKYHRYGLATAGFELRWSEVCYRAARQAVYMALSPRSTLARITMEVQERWSAMRRREAGPADSAPSHEPAAARPPDAGR